MALDPLGDYATLKQFMEPKYAERQFMEELQRRCRIAENALQHAQQQLKDKDKQLMIQQIDQWRTAIEELGKMEVMLHECIGREQRGLLDGMGWPGRLDQLVGELTRYREALMRRIADKALERLAPALETQGEKSTTLMNNSFGV